MGGIFSPGEVGMFILLFRRDDDASNGLLVKKRLRELEPAPTENVRAQ